MAIETVQDPERGELRRETGYGQVKDVKLEAGKRNGQVVINAEHLRDPVQGWVDSQGDREVYLAAVAAHDQGQRVYYRIETVRKSGVDISIPFADLDRNQKAREMREIVAVNGDGVPLDGSTPTAPASTTPEGVPDLPRAGEIENPPPPPPREGRKARVAEGKPWEPQNSDGSLNLGSYAVQAAEGMALLAQDLLVQRWRADGGDAPSMKQVRALARLLLLAADRAQASARADGHADRMDNSHVRARSAVRAALEVHPVPFGADEPTRNAWLDALTAHASEFLTVVLSLIDREVP